MCEVWHCNPPLALLSVASYDHFLLLLLDGEWNFDDIGKQMMGKVNQERLAEYLGELKRKEDTNDRYVAALRGETLTRKPYVRIQPVSSDEDKKEQKTDQK